MAIYRIRNVLSPMDLHHGGDGYLVYVKQRMIRELAAKMFEVFGDMPVKQDRMTGEHYLEFTLNSWEDHEVAKAEQVARAEGWTRGVLDERVRWQDRVAELEALLADQKRKPPTSEGRGLSAT